MSAHVNNMLDGAMLRAVGRQVRKWVEDGTVPVNDPARARQELEAQGVEFNDPAGGALKVIVHQNDETTYHLAAPSQTQLNDIVTATNIGGYRIIQDFELLLEDPPVNPDERMDLYMLRLGDYFLQHCR